ncbi:hypothetical protein HHI36_018289, partial [Cryptolaemus montrouzieri]
MIQLQVRLILTSIAQVNSLLLYRTKSNSNENKNPQVVCNKDKATGKDTSIQGATRRRWLCVGRISSVEVTEDDIKKYLADIDDHDRIQ